jgi:hypothetical protein
MNIRTKTGLEILQAGLVLGILGDAILRTEEMGLNFFLWISTVALAIVTLLYRHKKGELNFQTIGLVGAMVFFSAMPVIRDSDELRVLDVLTIFVILAVLLLQSLNLKTHLAGVFHYGIAWITAWANAFLGPLFLVFADIQWNKMPRAGWAKSVIPVVRGVAIAAPILFIFGALFMAADSVFEGIVERVFRFSPEHLMPHVIVTGLLTWVTAGYLRGLMFGVTIPETETKDVSITLPLSVTEKAEPVTEGAAEAPKEQAPPPPEKTWSWQNLNNSILPESMTLGTVELCIILGLMNLLFLTFVVIQVPYLFGGMTLVQATPDFKLAEYARRGFFELIWVALLVLPILLATHWLLRRDKPINEKLFTVLAGIQIGLLFVIMLSAGQRMLLYTGSLGYGLTTARFYPMAFMSWLALVFVWFVLTVLRGAREQFAWGALWLAFFVLATLHVMNPDDFIVRTNVRLWQQGRMFDSYYATTLSRDATPVILESLPNMSAEQQCAVKRELGWKKQQLEKYEELRSWNYSRWMALRSINANAEALSLEGCSTPVVNTTSDRELPTPSD